MGSLKKILFGVSSRKRDDATYQAAYDKGFEAGQRFADKVGISWLAARIQYYGSKHKIIFLCTAFGIVLTLLGLNIYHFVRVYSRQSVDTPNPISLQQLDSIKKQATSTSKMIPYEQN